MTFPPLLDGAMVKNVSPVDLRALPPSGQRPRGQRPRRIGYARVSTADQNLDLQIQALQKARCAVIYTEEASGSGKARPELEAALRALRQNDTLVVWRLDRVGRSTREVLQLLEWLQDNQLNFETLKEGQFDNTPIGKLLLHVAAVFAEFEKNVIKERTMAGLEAARARGHVGGRKRILDAEDIELARRLIKTRSSTEVAFRLKVSPSTLFRYLRGAHEQAATAKAAERAKRIRK